jgi:hypothetical protein
MKNVWLRLLTVALLTTATLTLAEANDLYILRKWTSVSGAEITATFVQLSGDKVELKSHEGEPFQIPRVKLSAQDQTLLDEAFGLPSTPKSTADGGAEYSDIQFSDQEIHTQAITICIDISPSMRIKDVNMNVLTDSIKLLEDLNANTKFNIIVFADGAQSFEPLMVPATPGEKERAITWLKKPFNHRSHGNLHGYSGSTPYQAIRMSVEMRADTIFILTDDLPYLKKGDAITGDEIPDHTKDILKYVKDIEQNTGCAVRIFPILYKPLKEKQGKAGIRFYGKLANATGGKHTVVRKITTSPTPSTPPPWKP